MPVGTLKPKQLLFCKEYLIDFNGTQAAIRAGYSKKTAAVIAVQNLAKLNIQSQIQKELDKRTDRIDKSGDEVVRLLWKMATLDLANYITVAEGGEVQAIAFDQLPEGASKLISEIVFKTNKLKYKLPEKTKCLEMLGRHYGLFNDKLIHSGTIKLEDVVAGE